MLPNTNGYIELFPKAGQSSVGETEVAVGQTCLVHAYKLELCPGKVQVVSDFRVPFCSMSGFVCAEFWDSWLDTSDLNT